MGALAGLTRRGKEQRRLLQDKLASDAGRAAAAKDNCKGLARRTSQLRRDQDTFDRFEAANGWRRDDISRLRGQLDRHWAEVVAACVQADDPLAYGVDKLRHARATAAGDLLGLDAMIPVDRATEHDEARRQLTDALTARQQAEEALGNARAAFDESGRRRWGRKDQQEVARAKAGVVLAEQRLERVAAGEGKLQERFASLGNINRSVSGQPRLRMRGANGSRPRWPSSTSRSTTPGPTASAPSPTTRLPTWSSGSGQCRAHPPVAPRGATTRLASKPSSTARSRARRPRGRARPWHEPGWRSPSPTCCCTRTPTWLTRLAGPSSSARPLPSAMRRSAS